MSSDAEMQYLQPGRPSGQSARTAVSTSQPDTKPEARLLQLILDELRISNESKATPELARTETQDFASSPPALTQPEISISTPNLLRGISHGSTDSLPSPTGSGESRFYEKLFTAVVAFAAFGGSITFQCIFQTIPEATEKPLVSPKRARTFIAISWLIFTMDLSLSSMVLAALYVARTRTPGDPRREKDWNEAKVQIFRFVNLIAALVLPLGSVAALVFAALAVSVVSIAVGKTALISVIVLGGTIFMWWCSFCVRHYFRRKSEKDSSKSTV